MLKKNKQLFVSKYQLYLPTQEEVFRLLGNLPSFTINTILLP